MTPPDDHPDEALQGRSTTIKNDNWILAQPFLRLRELYRTEGGALPDPILNLTWGYTNPGDPDLEKIAQDVNGYNLQTGSRLATFGDLADDGSKTAGNWIYTGSFPDEGNLMDREPGVDNPARWARDQGLQRPVRSLAGV